MPLRQSSLCAYVGTTHARSFEAAGAAGGAPGATLVLNAAETASSERTLAAWREQEAPACIDRLFAKNRGTLVPRADDDDGRAPPAKRPKHLADFFNPKFFISKPRALRAAQEARVFRMVQLSISDCRLLNGCWLLLSRRKLNAKEQEVFHSNLQRWRNDTAREEKAAEELRETLMHELSHRNVGDEPEWEDVKWALQLGHVPTLQTLQLHEGRLRAQQHAEQRDFDEQNRFRPRFCTLAGRNRGSVLRGHGCPQSDRKVPISRGTTAR
jgi:hypothetical protein